MIRVNIDKAKVIAHDMRRAARANEFEPLDAIIAKQIPGTDLGLVEANRQAIRDKYNAMQTAIDAAQSADELKALLK